MNIPVYQVDAFTQEYFSGNPAAVCLLDNEKPASWMQAVAAEMNLSETAFTYPENGGYRLRWFTPVTEVNLCGHATLATAHILWECGNVTASQTIKFHTNSGVLSTRQFRQSIELNFPLERATRCDAPDGLIAALGVTPGVVMKCCSDLLLVLENEQAVQNLQPDFQLLSRIPVRGVIVTAMSDSEDSDFVSRFFAPRIGINEDPVTGSVHGVLARYWSGQLNKQRMTARQLSRRGGVLELELRGERILIRGHARTVLKGVLCADA